MTSMRLTSTCCVRSGAVCQEDAIVQGAELGQRQRTAAIRTACERPAKSLRIGPPPREKTPFLWTGSRGSCNPCPVLSSFSRLVSARSILPTHATRRFSTSAVWRLSLLSCSRQAASIAPGGVSPPQGRATHIFHIHSVSTPASSSWASTSGQKRRMYVSSLPSR